MVNYAVITAVGKVREKNEDNYYANGEMKKEPLVKYKKTEKRQVIKPYLYAVCDGMGGEKHGEKAAEMAVETLGKRHKVFSGKGMLVRYFQEANNLICAEIEKNNGERMGTTLALLYINKGKAKAYNIGDSRVYLFREGTLTQLSEDHTQAQTFSKMGLSPFLQTYGHKEKHVLTQHLGLFADEMTIEPYQSAEIIIRDEDVFLLCSDGLTDMVPDEKIGEVLENKENRGFNGAEILLKCALQNGGRDNITLILVQVNKKKIFSAKEIKKQKHR